MSDEERQRKKSLIDIKRRRLHILEGKHAHYGIDTPPDCLMEIEDLRKEIAQLESELTEAEAQVRSAHQSVVREAEVPVSLDYPILRSLVARQNTPRLSFRPPRVDRELQKEWFLKTLRGNQHRGAIVRSGPGWGKSVLLAMFKDESEVLLPKKTFFFDPSDRVQDWKDILDETVNALGKDFFRYYTQISEVEHTKKDQYISDNNNYQFTQLENNSTEMSQGGGNMGNSMMSFQNSALVSSKRYYEQVTDRFILDVESMSTVDKIVWLVDAVEEFDRTTHAWLTYFFWCIAQQRVTKVILVIACDNEIKYRDPWDKTVQEITDLRFSDYSIIIDLLRKMNLYPYTDGENVDEEQLLIEELKSLMRSANYRPLDICSAIEYILRTGVSDV